MRCVRCVLVPRNLQAMSLGGCIALWHAHCWIVHVLVLCVLAAALAAPKRSTPKHLVHTQ